MNNNRLYTTIILSFLMCISSCSEAPSVPKSECKKVVAHAKSILKDKAPSKSKMLKQCEKASDTARGCVMSSKKAMQILQCDF